MSGRGPSAALPPSWRLWALGPRLPLPLPAAPAALAAVGSRYGRDPSPADGVLAADVFDAFEAGKTPTQVVQEYELVPRLVADLYRQFLELRAAAGPRGPTVSDRLVLLEQGMAQLRAAHDELAFTVPFTTRSPLCLREMLGEGEDGGADPLC